MYTVERALKRGKLAYAANLLFEEVRSGAGRPDRIVLLLNVLRQLPPGESCLLGIFSRLVLLCRACFCRDCLVALPAALQLLRSDPSSRSFRRVARVARRGGLLVVVQAVYDILGRENLTVKEALDCCRNDLQLNNFSEAVTMAKWVLGRDPANHEARDLLWAASVANCQQEPEILNAGSPSF